MSDDIVGSEPTLWEEKGSYVLSCWVVLFWFFFFISEMMCDLK